MAVNSTRRVAAIDCGTNTIRLLISDVAVAERRKTDLLHRMDVVRLGEGVDRGGRLAESAIARVESTCESFLPALTEFDPEVVSFCATSAVRDAANSEEFCTRIEHVLGSRPEVLTGEQEAAASFDGATREIDAEGPVAVIDLGGGSTEVVVGSGGVVRWSHSFDVGSVRMKERFLASDPPTAEQKVACVDYLDAVIAPVLAEISEPVACVVGVAGTITTIGAIALGLREYSAEAVHLAPVPTPELRKTGGHLVDMTIEKRRAIRVMHPGRADVIGAGALVMDRVLEHLPMLAGEVTLSSRDILDGIAWRAAQRA